MNAIFFLLTLHVQEDHFLSVTVMVFGSDYVLSAILQLDSVYDEGVIVAGVSFHEFNALLQFFVIVIPRDRGLCNGDHATVELDALSFVRERALRLDHESWSRLSAICKI